MSTPFVIAAMYRFVAVPEDDLGPWRDALLRFLRDRQITGSLLLAPEGINGTVAGSRAAIDALLTYLKTDDLFGGKLADLEQKESFADDQPFGRAKVRLKREIVSMGAPDLFNHCETETDRERVVGAYVEPRDWNALIDDPHVTLIDTRNGYEFELGTFEQHIGDKHRPAIDPQTETFREFPAFVDAQLDPARHKKVAMFCTGGIRCEKATAYLKAHGFDQVYHLKGGILKYLEEVPVEDSRWRGECYVFDDRVSVDHDLEPGTHDICYACGLPVAPEDMNDERYEPGVSCPRCFGTYPPQRVASFRERQRQIELCKQRGARKSASSPDTR